jgi:hypothetical protein
VAYFADKSQKKPFVVATFAFFTAFPLMLMFSKSFLMLAAAFMLRGLKEFGEPTRKALIMDLAPEDRKAGMFGLYYLIRDVIVSVAAFGGAFLWRASPELNLWAAFAFGAAGTLWFAFFGRDLSGHTEERRRGSRAEVAEDAEKIEDRRKHMNGADSGGMARDKRPVGRIVAWAVASLLLAAGVFCLVQYVQMEWELRRAGMADLLRMNVDLSRPGRYEGSYHQTFLGAHSAKFGLYIDPAPADSANTTQPAGDFEANAAMFDANGQSVFQQVIPSGFLESLLTEGNSAPGRWEMLRISPGLPLGTYKFVLNVRRPATALAGRKQIAVIKYVLCGLEALPSFVVGLGALAFGLTGGIIALVLLVGRAKRRRAQKLAKEAY